MAPQLLIVVTAGFFAGAVACGVIPLLRRAARTPFSEQLRTLGAPDPADLWVPRKTLEELELSRPLAERVLKPLFQSLRRACGRLPGGNPEAVGLRLARAGTPRGLSVEAFLGLRVVTALVGAAVALVLQVLSLPAVPAPSAYATPIWTALCAIAGFFLPELWLKDLTRRRQKMVRHVLPDVLDTISITMAAGLAFDGALERVSQFAKNPLSDEFTHYLTEIRLGVPRRDALLRIGQRTGVDDLQTFISAVIQANQLGVSVSRLLRTYSEELRIKRRQRAEKVAQQAPLKMLFPMILFIFPSVFVVILGPAIRQLTSLSGH